MVHTESVPPAPDMRVQLSPCMYLCMYVCHCVAGAAMAVAAGLLHIPPGEDRITQEGVCARGRVWLSPPMASTCRLCFTNTMQMPVCVCACVHAQPHSVIRPACAVLCWGARHHG